ncbi:MAG: TatD family hydrolase [Aliivibrio sp.]|uniref:TatD family hydrolase n=1 Tax=Aliivibrio sp. TaxID=1872443 RepID=UPI001A585EC6|nr:TatD family hydrolase [Aliivibrio sp.]
MTTPHRFIDTHCHFDFDVFKRDFTQQLNRAKNAGVETIVVPSIGEKNWSRVELLAEQYPEIYYALGCHPFFIDQHSDDVIRLLNDKLMVRNHRCVAIGECGLDKIAAKNETQWQQQLFLFNAHCSLATTYQLPLIVHSRKTHSEILSILKKHHLPENGVIHGFSGSYQQAMQFVELGFSIGVGGTITYPRANKTRMAISQLPLNSLVLETDAPDMPIHGRQGETNHPQYMNEIFECLCQLRNEDTQTIASAIVENSNSLFGF